jgi:uncharacterized protein YbbC (DUF1343 family)
MKKAVAVLKIGLLSGILLFLLAEEHARGGAASGPDAKTDKVLNGIDVLRRDNYTPLAGKAVGLITNQTGRSIDGIATIDLLLQSKRCRVVALFNPEHGIRGGLEGSVTSSVDHATGLPVYSLYGETRRPTAEMLQGIDALVFDIQDVGARFYTYATTMAYCMEEAAKAKIPFYVLDRPNPIGGVLVEGPMMDANKASFTGYMPMPVRHGMTIGELAQYFNAENHIGVDLQVIPMEGWKRSYMFPDTGQLWVDPSPNIRSVVAEVLYPGVCLLEGTNVSVGRGTDRPFEIVGAPWVDPRRFAAELNDAHVPGVEFVPFVFTPKADTNAGLKCGGVNLVAADLESVHSVLLGLTLISVLHRLYPGEFEIDKTLRLLGNEGVLRELKAAKTPAEIIRSSDLQMVEFLKVREKALIYSR